MNKRPRLFALPAIGRRSFLEIGIAGYASLMSGCWSRGSGAGSGTTRSFLLKGRREWVSSVCTLCPSACAIRAYSEGGRIVAVGGDPDDPNTGGKMCPVGLSALNLHANPDRLTGAFRRDPAGKTIPAKADAVLGLIADRIRRGAALHIHGRITPFTSLLSKKLHAACHVDRASEEMSAYPAFLNTEGRPPVLDFDNARIALLFDSNILEHGYPFVGYVRRIAEARSRGLHLVTLSPFLTNTATAGEWVPIRSRAAASLAALSVARQALKDESVRVSAIPGEVTGLLRKIDEAFLEEASGLSPDVVRDLTRRFFSEPGPAISDSHDPSVLLLNIMKGNLNRPGGLLHPGLRRLKVEAESDDISRVLEDSGNVVLLHGTNPVFDQSLEVCPVLRSSSRASVVCFDSFMSETAGISDYVLPLASPLETLILAEPLPLGQPFLAAAPPAVKPGADCFSFDDWLTRLAEAVDGAAPQITPARFAAETLSGNSSGGLDANRAVYPMKADPQKLEARISDIVASLEQLMERMQWLPGSQGTLQEDQCYLAAFEESVQGFGAAPSKWLGEIAYSPRVYLHPGRADRLGIHSGDAVTIEDGSGASREGVALVFEGIHPDALAIPMHHGHTGYGGVARGESFEDPRDPDMARIFWGKNRGINPAEISGSTVTIQKRRS